jgi:hypothetical protein
MMLNTDTSHTLTIHNADTIVFTKELIERLRKYAAMNLFTDPAHEADLRQVNMIILNGEDCFAGDDAFSEMLEAGIQTALEKRMEIGASICVDQLARSMANRIMSREISVLNGWFGEIVDVFLENMCPILGDFLAGLPAGVGVGTLALLLQLARTRPAIAGGLAEGSIIEDFVSRTVLSGGTCCLIIEMMSEYSHFPAFMTSFSRDVQRQIAIMLLKMWDEWDGAAAFNSLRLIADAEPLIFLEVIHSVLEEKQVVSELQSGGEQSIVESGDKLSRNATAMLVSIWFSHESLHDRIAPLLRVDYVMWSSRHGDINDRLLAVRYLLLLPQRAREIINDEVLQYIDDVFSVERGDDESDGAECDEKIVATIILLGFLRQSDHARVILFKYWDAFEELLEGEQMTDVLAGQPEDIQRLLENLGDEVEVVVIDAVGD